MRHLLSFFSLIAAQFYQVSAKFYRTVFIVTTVLGLVMTSAIGCDDNNGGSSGNEPPEDPPQWTCASDPTLDIITADPSTGWVDKCNNTSYFQGQWFDDTDVDSSITTDFSDAESGEFCASGEAGQVVADGYSHWGAAMGFYLCQTDNDETPPSEHFTLSDCPWDGALSFMSTASGMRATFSGDVDPDDEIRVIFREAGRTQSTYIESGLSGSSANFDFGDAVSPDGNPIDADNIEAIVFQVVASDSEDIVFDFCVSGISFY